MSIAPSSGTVMLGNQLMFTATVKNASDETVTWSVNGVAGGNGSVGTVTADGVYTAPLDLPNPASVQVVASSHVNAAKFAAATIQIQSDIVVTLGAGSRAISVELGASQVFQAAMTSGGHPDANLQWSVSGVSCPLACGTVDASGRYTAPRILPSPANIMLVVRSAADPSKQASAQIIITSNFVLQLSAPGSVTAGGTAMLATELTPVPASNPSTLLTWMLFGSGCNGASCGTLTVAATVSGAGNVSTTSATYVAPDVAPAPNTITIVVTPLADPSKAVQAVIAIGAASVAMAMSLTPTTATRAVSHRLTLTVQVTGATDTNVNWTVNGLPGGSAEAGQVCALGSSPCEIVTTGSARQVDYLAPAALPVGNPVTVRAVSTADANTFATAQITIINHVLVSVLPNNATLAPRSVQQFTATVLGTDNQNAIWQVQGSGCASAGSCGLISAEGAYTAPGAAPTPDALQAVAISVEDARQSGFANLTIATGLNIRTLHPSSVYQGAANGFTLKVIGSGFGISSAGKGSTMLIGGAARITTCDTAEQCIAPVTAADVAQTGDVSVQIENSDGSRSNAVSLVVAARNISGEVIGLSAKSPDARGKDIVVVEPTTAGVSVSGDNVDLNVAALGLFTVTNNNCTLGGNPVVVTRPMSGTSTVDVCLFSFSGLDASMSYSVTGPGDVTVIAKQPVGLGIIRLTLHVPANAVASVRTLFIENTNLDQTAASGMLWVK